MRKSSPFLVSGLVIALSGCGGHKTTLPVSVTDKNATRRSRQPSSQSAARHQRSEHRCQRQRSCPASTGIYRVIASKDGYVPTYEDVTISQDSQPSRSRSRFPTFRPQASGSIALVRLSGDLGDHEWSLTFQEPFIRTSGTATHRVGTAKRVPCRSIPAAIQ